MEEYDRFERSYQPNVALLSVPNQEQPEVSVMKEEQGAAS